MILTSQVGLIVMSGETDHAARFAGVDVVMGATVVVDATSGVQEGTTDTDHGGLDGGREMWRNVARIGSEFIPGASWGPLGVHVDK